MLLAGCQPRIWLPAPGSGGNSLPFFCLGPRGFKGRALGPNPPRGARRGSDPSEHFPQWMELVPGRFPVRGTLGFPSVGRPLSRLLPSHSVPSLSLRGGRETRGWESHPSRRSTRRGRLSGFPIAAPRLRETGGEPRAQTVSSWKPCKSVFRAPRTGWEEGADRWS